MSEKPIHELVSKHLAESDKHIDAEVYYKALSAIKDAKFTDPRNIYIIALEKQVKQLADFSKSNPDASARKKEIRDAIPELIRRAIEDSRKRVVSRDNINSAGEGSGNDADPYKRERELALKKLKDQFINIAEEYIDRGDFQSALDEIRRIFIIDPNNSTAKNLELKIQSLVNSGDGEIQDSTPVKKSKSFSLGKIVPFVIAVLILINLIIYYITSMNSSEGYSSAGMVAGTSAEREATEYTETSPPSGSVLPDAVMREREYVPRTHSVNDDLINDSSHFTNNILIKDVTVDTEEESTGSLDTTELSAIIVENDGVSEQYPDARVSVGETDVIKRLEKPEYPIEALEQGIEGDVVVRVLFDADGSANVSFIESSDHPLLSDSALKSAQLSEFSPTDTSGLSGPEWISIPYQFRISR